VINYKNGDTAKLGYMQHLLIYTICTFVRSTLQKENNAANITATLFKIFKIATNKGVLT
jgi:hypothetical protein